MSQKPKLTGERPTPGSTPDSLLALHAAGYREINGCLGEGLVLEAGCGLGFESANLAVDGRRVVGIDYDKHSVAQANANFEELGFVGAAMDASNVSFLSGSFDYVTSSHLIEHFRNPGKHVAEMARVLKASGTAVFVTPNAPADFENPFHVTSFEKNSLKGLLGQYFGQVWVGGLDGLESVKSDFKSRRVRANKLLALDALGLRKRIPRSWYVGAYTRILPLAYRLVASGDSGGSTGITESDFVLKDSVDTTTLVLFAIAREPRSLLEGGSSGR